MQHHAIAVEPRQPLPPYSPQFNIARWADHLQIQREGELPALREAYVTNDLLMVSDGSYKEGIGSAAWIITSKTDRKLYIKGQCPTTGNPTSQDSHRSELFGILVELLILHNQILTWDQPKGTITVGLDNTSALAYAFDTKRYPVAMSSYPDFDVIQSIRSLCLDCITFRMLHIP